MGYGGRSTERLTLAASTKSVFDQARNVGARDDLRIARDASDRVANCHTEKFIVSRGRARRLDEKTAFWERTRSLQPAHATRKLFRSGRYWPEVAIRRLRFARMRPAVVARVTGSPASKDSISRWPARSTSRRRTGSPPAGPGSNRASGRDGDTDNALSPQKSLCLCASNPRRVIGHQRASEWSAGPPALRDAFARGKLQFHGKLTPLRASAPFHAFLRPLPDTEWVVYAKPPFGGGLNMY
jgi:hypothetical protein